MIGIRYALMFLAGSSVGFWLACLLKDIEADEGTVGRILADPSIMCMIALGVVAISAIVLC